MTGLLAELVGHLGEGAIVKPSLRCDYGTNIRIGARTFINYDCVLLDCNTIKIGAEVRIAPGVHIYTATHPLDAATRRSGLESALPVTIGDGAWLGGRSVICPGVTIGENTVVGAGSVVTRDLPAGVLAVGNPCRIVRDL
ncbi:sugar O-acetyltransferase [Sphingomonas rubra]|uniref:Nodulation protein L n=1 Tax=Sphingomonas rubra TaxID=634430 RepID=A0A1I5SBE8_9SPHN|nr:sugar O-acetyltransferase [Sphingomonas rubra]SFP68022.1 maltose O-acetyltransferase [Sphingomonas rubra]